VTKKTYTFNECYAILGVDPKTFRRWLKKADINPDAQRSKLDERIRYLTQGQIDQLAADHERTLIPLEEAHTSTDSVPSSTYKRLLEELNERVEDLSTQTERHGRIWQDLLAKIEHQAERIYTLEQQLAETKQTIATLQAPKRATKAKNAPDTADTLPEGLIAWRTFADLHRAPQTTAGRYIEQGMIHAVKGKWKIGGGYVKEALDAAGRRDFWVQFHSKDGFSPCNDCPHEIPEQQAAL
jgi:predicted site-specific integrase-resolvase